MNNYFITRINALQAKPEFLNENNEDKEKALYAKGWNACNKEYIGNLLDIPAEDVRPVKQGEWMMMVDSMFNGERFVEWTCSECGYVHNRGWRHTNDGKDPDAKFCENCGAKMGDADE